MTESIAGFDLVEETVALHGRELSIVRPRDADELVDEEAFEHEEFLPYWAELWPSALALARAVCRLPLEGATVVELGCGLGVPSVTAAHRGARVLASDWAPDALAFVELNASRNGVLLETALCSWHEPAPLVARAPFDLVLASDVLYERRDVEPLLDLLPRLGTEVLLADPGRPAAKEFSERAAQDWRIETEPGRVALHRLRRR